MAARAAASWFPQNRKFLRPYVGNTIMLALKDKLFVFKRIDTTMPTCLVAV